jgi:hypothetical protein
MSRARATGRAMSCSAMPAALISKASFPSGGRYRSGRSDDWSRRSAQRH